ncbi:N-acetyltransferase [Butyrivibrio sp. CB08]|uniref:GNAT family N-acetyltransferase n=1 Tax=Butyrivibrio sp. CB08 TaxID=2364879 RepID=UPI000EA9E058|nr:N-acetyltransferase [Butyrivibrio sp. CB08]
MVKQIGIWFTPIQVATVHLLAVSPSYQGRSLGIKILEEAMKIAVRNGKKALRLDVPKTPALQIFCTMKKYRN